jgi:hypothetical protein
MFLLFFFRHLTPALQKFFTLDEWEIMICGDLSQGKMGSPSLEAGKLILIAYYGQQFNSNSYQTMTFRPLSKEPTNGSLKRAKSRSFGYRKKTG